MIKAYTALCKLSGLLDMNEDNFGADMCPALNKS